MSVSRMNLGFHLLFDGTYPVCDLAQSEFTIEHLDIVDSVQAYEAEEYATCRLNIPFQCCYDVGLQACTKPIDGSQYCYESAQHCLKDCGGGEFCYCSDPKGVGCSSTWFVPGAHGTDNMPGVHCDRQIRRSVSESRSAKRNQPCYQGRAPYPRQALEEMSCGSE